MKRSKLTIDNNSPLTFPQSMTKFIPVNAALKALSAAGHDVSKKGRLNGGVAQLGNPSYFVDGKPCSLSQVRRMVSDLGLEQKVKKSHQKPKREIELISEAVSKNEWCKSRNTNLSTFGERHFDGRVYYSISQDSSDGSRKCYFMTIPRIRVWAERNKVI
jgi:hypothetical protein